MSLPQILRCSLPLRVTCVTCVAQDVAGKDAGPRHQAAWPRSQRADPLRLPPFGENGDGFGLRLLLISSFMVAVKASR